jgi:MFS family permease
VPDRRETAHPHRRRRSLPFYGWLIVLAAALTTFSSGPGQSYTFAVVIDPILAETGFSRTLLSTLYAGGTAVSAAMTLVVGRLVDRLGARRMLAVVALLFALACVGLSRAQGVLGLFLGFAALRALGQGSLPVIATLLTAQWFVRYRGRAMAMVTLGFALSNASFPPLTQALVSSFGWRGAYIALGGLLVAVLLPAALLARDRPETLGLFPDGAAAPPASEQVVALGVAATDMPTLRSASFWLLALPLTAGPFVVTALVFHQVSIFAERGLGAAIAAGVFVAFSAAAASATLLGGLLVERFGPKRLLLGNLMLMATAVASLQLVSDPASATLYAALLGACSGIQSVTNGVAWATYYGRRGLGRLQGSAAMVTISAAALAPLPLAAWQQAAGSYGPGLTALIAVPLLCAAILLRFQPPHHAGWNTAAL